MGLLEDAKKASEQKRMWIEIEADKIIPDIVAYANKELIGQAHNGYKSYYFDLYHMNTQNNFLSKIDPECVNDVLFRHLMYSLRTHYKEEGFICDLSDGSVSNGSMFIRW